MDRDLARIILHATHGSERGLAELVPVLREHCSEDDYKRMSRAIAGVMHDLESTIRQPIYLEHPELEQEIEDRVKRFGRIF
ncbi:MAG: hypothetical protein JSR98_00410 [Proteobacteria bacterium]|nr:hypothetical protein [Pseudomonadota bacterium]